MPSRRRDRAIGEDDLFDEPTDPEMQLAQPGRDASTPSMVSIGPGSGVRALADLEKQRAQEAPRDAPPEPPVHRPPRRFAAPGLAPAPAPGAPAQKPAAPVTAAVPSVVPLSHPPHVPTKVTGPPLAPLSADGSPGAAPADLFDEPSDPAARPPRPPPPVPAHTTSETAAESIAPHAVAGHAADFEGAHPTLSLEPLRPGETVAGRYTIVGSLGQGGMAEVYLAELCGAAGFTKTVVVKRVLPALARDQRFVELFVREAHVASSLTHANVVQLFELGEDRGTYFIAMEYVRGMTLADLARRSWKLGESLPLELLLLSAADAAEGLSYGWRTQGRDGAPFRLVHRDVSPDNLIINTEGLTKVLDYGIAKGAGSANLTRVGELKGKMSYIPPEEVKGNPRDHRSDLYALGTTLYWLTTRKMPFEVNAPMDLFEKVVLGDVVSPRVHNPSLPKEVEKFILKLMQKEPDKRFQDGQDVVDCVLSMLGAAARRGPSGEFVSAMLKRAMEADEAREVSPDLIPAIPTSEHFGAAFDRGPGTFRRLAMKLFHRD